MCVVLPSVPRCHPERSPLSSRAQRGIFPNRLAACLQPSTWTWAKQRTRIDADLLRVSHIGVSATSQNREDDLGMVVIPRSEATRDPGCGYRGRVATGGAHKIPR